LLVAIIFYKNILSQVIFDIFVFKNITYIINVSKPVVLDIDNKLKL